MSLKVWLPLDGDLHNQGLTKLPESIINTLEYSAGKIGQCGTGRVAWHLSEDFLDNTWSVAMWVRPTALGSNNNVMLCKNVSGSSDCQIYFSIVSTTQLNIGVNGPSSSLKVTGLSFTDQWYHVAATYDGSTVALYLNGVQKKTGTVTSAAPTGRLNLTLNGRSTNAAGTVVTGGATFSFNDVRIYDHCLSAAEVKEIAQGLILHYKLDDQYIEGTTNLVAGTYNYQTKEIGQYTASIKSKTTYGNKIFTYSVYIKNTSDHPLAARFTPYNAADTNYSSYIGNYIQPGQEGRSVVTVNITDTSKWNGKAALHIQNGKSGTVPTNKTFHVKEIQLEEKNHATPFTPTSREAITNIYDSSGYGHNGTITGTLTIDSDTAHYSSSTYISSGNTNYITTPTLQLPGDQITMNFWFKSSNTSPGSNYHIPFAGTANSNQSYEMSIHQTGYLRGGLVVSGSRKVDDCTSKNLINGNWHMCTMTYDGTIIKRYVDGIMEKSTTTTGTLITSTQFVLGHYGTNTSYYAKQAYISDVRLYVTALSETDIKQLYEVRAKIDKEQNLHTFEFNEFGSNQLTKTGIMKDYMIEPYKTLPDGSYWKLMLFHYVDKGNNLFTSSNATYNNGFGLYSRLRDINNYTYNGKYEFYVIQDGTEYRWTQTSQPTASSIAGLTTVFGYNNPVNGLAKANSRTYIGYNAWWGACGCWTKYSLDGKTGIPGFGTHDANGICEKYLALYARIDKSKVQLTDGSLYGENLIEF